MSEKTASWWADEVIRRMEADPNTDLAPVAVGQMITAQVFAEAIAAAEERGRRRGVEDLQTMLQNAAPHIIGAGHFRLWNCKCGYCAPLQAALAPRDSAPDPDPTCPEDFEPPWPRDSGKEGT